MSEIVKFCDYLAQENSEALSFIPRPRLEQYAEAGQILLAKENDDPCGFLIFGNGWPVMRIYQACIQYDARRREHGISLVKQLIAIADSRGCEAISLWCANDLEANKFWRECGFIYSGSREGGKRRGRMHNLWRLQLQPNLFSISGAGEP